MTRKTNYNSEIIKQKRALVTFIHNVELKLAEISKKKCHWPQFKKKQRKIVVDGVWCAIPAIFDTFRFKSFVQLFCAFSSKLTATTNMLQYDRQNATNNESTKYRIQLINEFFSGFFELSIRFQLNKIILFLFLCFTFEKINSIDKFKWYIDWAIKFKCFPLCLLNKLQISIEEIAKSAIKQ